MKFIDPHIHLWDINAGDYHWLKAHLNQHSDLPSTVHENTLHEEGCAAFVHIEAGFDNLRPWRELQWLEASANCPMRSIATVDLTLPCGEFEQHLARIQEYQSCVGVRHILDEQAFRLLSTPHVIQNLNAIAHSDLLFEAQFPLSDQRVSQIIDELFTANPTWRWVINHAGHAPIDSVHSHVHKNESWQKGLDLLAKHTGITMKCSGYEMQQRDFVWQNVHCIVESCIAAFGVHRVMLASNYPLLTWRMSYREYWSELTQVYADRPELYYDNAKRVYFA